jgi:putative transposase
MEWNQLLASITGSVNEELRLRNAYLAVENRILRNQIKTRRVLLTNAERQMLAELGHTLGRQALAEIATIAKPDTILAWHRKLMDQQGVPAQPRQSVGRPRIDKELEDLVVRMARENRSWGYDRIVGALRNLGYHISDQTVGNILKRHGLPPAPERKKTTTWREFVRSHMDMLMVTDFFTSAVWSWLRLLISSLLCFLHYGHHQVYAVGVRLHQHTQGMRAFLLPVFALSAHGQRWGYMITKRSQAMRCSGGVLGDTGSAFARTDERPSPSQTLGQVVFLSAIRPVQIRDRPLQRQRHCDRLLDDGDRKAA